MSRPPRRRRQPALLRGRFRTLFFALVAVAAILLGHWPAAVPAALAALAGVASVRIALRRGEELAHSFAVADWLLLGCVLALAGGADSWLLGAVPLLAMGQLAAAPQADRPYLVAPSLLLVIVLAIADPTLGGNRAAGLAKVAVLVAGGVVAAGRLHTRPATRRRRAPLVDAATGLSTMERLHEVLPAAMDAALADHAPLAVAYVRLEHFEDTRNFLGAQGADDLVRSVARRLERRLGPDGRAFRAAPDAFVLTLPGCDLGAARELCAAAAHDVSANLIAGHRQTLASGASSFPTVRGLDDLLAVARAEAAPAAPAFAAAPALPLAAAQ